MTRRRRALLLVVGAFLLTVAVLANYGPLHAYFDAQARLEKASAGIAELTAQKEDLQAEMGRLSESDYLESLARQDLSYARPGEELYIVTGVDTGVTTVSGASSEGTSQNGASASSGGTVHSDGPGFVERVLAPILDGP